MGQIHSNFNSVQYSKKHSGIDLTTVLKLSPNYAYMSCFLFLGEIFENSADDRKLRLFIYVVVSHEHIQTPRARRQLFVSRVDLHGYNIRQSLHGYDIRLGIAGDLMMESKRFATDVTVVLSISCRATSVSRQAQSIATRHTHSLFRRDLLCPEQYDVSWQLPYTPL